MDFDIDTLLTDADGGKSKSSVPSIASKVSEPTPPIEQSKDNTKGKTNLTTTFANKYQSDPLDDSLDTSAIPTPAAIGSRFGSNRPKSAPTATSPQDIDNFNDNKDTYGTTSSPQNQDIGYNNNSSKKSNDDVDLGFMPSFLEPGREPRSRRYLLFDNDL